ncbi:hypothetical protein ENC19_18535 [Verrucosispora sp. CWR15]|uniref:Uncharacterized protein n=1 Tax=Verrucosispora sioxanthis TaxID=2499994 RepID=A0A6M1L8E2_9ACTN|nr:hypothetical protein [Verrucosispora sioxanthis]NGM14514.1 hypothetical protein [Verrucosispora sioxanthis]
MPSRSAAEGRHERREFLLVAVLAVPALGALAVAATPAIRRPGSWAPWPPR